MDDGNVVISASHPSGEKTYFFKCHKSTLSKQSSVFSDMFTFPPSEEQEKFDGVPLVHLHDSSEDVESLLKYLYDPTYVAVICRPASCTPAQYPEFADGCLVRILFHLW